MIKSENNDVYLQGKPIDVIRDFVQIVAVFSKYIEDKAIEVNSIADPREVVIELFCQAMAVGGSGDSQTVIYVSDLERALKLLKEDEEEET